MWTKEADSCWSFIKIISECLLTHDAVLNAIYEEVKNMVLPFHIQNPKLNSKNSNALNQKFILIFNLPSKIHYMILTHSRITQ